MLHSLTTCLVLFAMALQVITIFCNASMIASAFEPQSRHELSPRDRPGPWSCPGTWPAPGSGKDLPEGYVFWGGVRVSVGFRVSGLPRDLKGEFRKKFPGPYVNPWYGLESRGLRLGAYGRLTTRSWGMKPESWTLNLNY